MEYNFDEFVSKIHKAVKERLADSHEVEIHQIPNNNGIMQTGMSIRRENGKLVNAILLHPYYRLINSGLPMEAAAEDILRTLEACGGQGISEEDVLDFERVKDGIILKIINTKANRELLEAVPHIPWMDLSIVFYMVLGWTDGALLSALVHHNHTEAWGLNTEELYCLARRNVEHMFPVQIKSMAEVIKEMIRDTLGEASISGLGAEAFNNDSEPSLYVLTNSIGLAGAYGMLPGMGLEELALRLNKDLVVLPSSIHEILAVPYEDGMNLALMSQMVQNINRMDVEKEDRLSDRVYYFDRKDGMRMVADDGEILQGMNRGFGIVEIILA